MTVLSKAAHIQRFRETTCSEFAHPWDPNCNRVWLNIFFMCVKASGLRLYAPLFIIPAIIRRKSFMYILQRTLPDVLRSAVFIATFATSFCVYVCNIRKLLGYNTILTNGIIPGFFASVSSMPIERKQRRRELALYCANHATSAVARSLRFHKIAPNVPFLDVAAFCGAMAALTWTLRKSPASLGSGVSGLFGWMMDVTIPQSLAEQDDAAASALPPKPAKPSVLSAFFEKLSYPRSALPLVAYLKALLARKTALCKHEHGCGYGASRGLLKGFALGFGLRGGIALVTSLLKYKHRLDKVLRAVFARSNLVTGVFLSVLFGGARGFECLLRALRQRDDGWNPAIAGALAGLSFLLSRNDEISMYMLWKSFEALFNFGEAKKLVPSFYHGDILLFSVACSILFHISVFEPHSLRPAYWNFLMKVSDGKWGEINRQVLSGFDFQSTALSAKNLK